MKLTLVLVSLLTGCAAMLGGNFEYLVGTQDYAQCEYQAKSSTPGSNSIMADVFREWELTNMCLKAKGYTSR